MSNTAQRTRRRSPSEFGGDPDLAYKSSVTVAMARTTLVAIKEKAHRQGASVSAIVREAAERFLETDDDSGSQ